VKLGEISVTTNATRSLVNIMPVIKQKAQRIGANAVMNFKIEQFEQLGNPQELDASISALAYANEYAAFQTVTVTAIRYESNLIFPDRVLKAERFFNTENRHSVEPLIQITYNWHHDQLKQSFQTKEAKSLYDQSIHQYADIHLLKENRGVREKRDEFDRPWWRTFTKFQGQLAYKRLQIHYNENGSRRNMKIAYLGDNPQDIMYREKIIFLYDFSAHLPSGRAIYKGKKKLVTEKWTYNQKGVVASKQYNFGKDQAELFCEMVYYTQAEWDELVATHLIQP